MTIGQKVKGALIILVCVLFAYLLVFAMSGTVRELVSSANTSLHATANMTEFFGTAETVNAWPWIMLFLPGIGGFVGIVIILRSPSA
jgi:hypothetical protein